MVGGSKLFLVLVLYFGVEVQVSEAARRGRAEEESDESSSEDQRKVFVSDVAVKAAAEGVKGLGDLIDGVAKDKLANDKEHLKELRKGEADLRKKIFSAMEKVSEIEQEIEDAMEGDVERCKKESPDQLPEDWQNMTPEKIWEGLKPTYQQNRVKVRGLRRKLEWALKEQEWKQDEKEENVRVEKKLRTAVKNGKYAAEQASKALHFAGEKAEEIQKDARKVEFLTPEERKKQREAKNAEQQKKRAEKKKLEEDEKKRQEDEKKRQEDEKIRQEDEKKAKENEQKAKRKQKAKKKADEARRSPEFMAARRAE